jgi:hypothetical protein
MTGSTVKCVICRPDDRLAAKAAAIDIAMKSYAPDIQLARTRIPRMTESSFSFPGTSMPFLLEEPHRGATPGRRGCLPVGGSGGNRLAPSKDG